MHTSRVWYLPGRSLLSMSSISLDAVETMRVFELKAALKAAGLDSEGKRAELV